MENILNAFMTKREKVIDHATFMQGIMLKYINFEEYKRLFKRFCFSRLSLGFTIIIVLRFDLEDLKDVFTDYHVQSDTRRLVDSDFTHRHDWVCLVMLSLHGFYTCFQKITGNSFSCRTYFIILVIL